MARKRSKYNIDTTKKGKRNRTFEGVEYDSETEMRFYTEVVVKGMKDGTILKCEKQVKYELQPKCNYKGETILPINYIADFVIHYSDGSIVVIDVKGLPDSSAKIKKKMFHYKYPNTDYKWMGYSKQDGGWLEYKEIEKARKQRKKEKLKNGKA